MEKLFTKKEAANYMKVSERTVSRMIKSMSLRIYRVGRQVRIPATSINKMLKGAKAGILLQIMESSNESWIYE